MKKSTKKFVTFLVCLVFMLLVYLVLRVEKRKHIVVGVVDKPQTNTVLSLPVQDIQHVRIFSSQRRVDLDKTEIWNLEGYNYPVSQQTVAVLTQNLSNLQAHLVLEAQNDLSVYGLAIPQKTIEVTLKNQQKVLVLIGNETPLGNDYYMQIHGKPEIYLLSSLRADAFSLDPSTYWQIELPPIDWQNIAETHIKRRDGTNIALQFSNQGQMFSKYQFIKPAPYAGFSVQTAEFYRLWQSWSQAMPSKEELKTPVQNWIRYGLQQPQLELQVADQHGAVLQLSVGDRSPQGDYYARTDREDAVFIIGKSYVQPFFNVTAFSLLSKFVALISSEMTALIRFTGPQQNFSLEILDVEKSKIKDIFEWSRSLLYHHTVLQDKERTGHTHELKQYFLNNRPLNEEEFFSLYQQIVSLSYEAETKLATTSQMPIFTLTYYAATGDVITQAEFMPYNERYYRVRLNSQQTPFLIGQYQIQSIVKSLSRAGNE